MSGANSRKVLITDDNRLVADTLALILSQHGYETCVTYGGREAVERARRWNPDLFISDVSMPEVDGVHAAIEIRTMMPACGVLLFSAEPESAELVRRARFSGHRFELLQKPFPPLELLRRIRRLQAA